MSRRGPKGPRKPRSGTPAQRETNDEFVDGPRTASNTRQMLRAGTVDDLVALHPALPSRSDIDLRVPRTGTLTRFKNREFEDAVAFIEKTGISNYLADTYESTKRLKGRPSVFNPLAVLVAMQLAVRDSRPLLGTELRSILLERLTSRQQRALGIKKNPRPTNHDEALLWDKRTAAAFRRALRRMLDAVDPSTLPKNRIRDWDEVHRLKKDLSLEEQHKRAVALDWVCNQLLEAAFQQLPEQVRDRASREGMSYCIDGTPLPLFARGRGVKNTVASADPDGGFYIREGDHRDPNDHARAISSGNEGRAVTRLTKVMWAREVNLVALADASHPDRLYLPALPFAFTTDRPGVDPAGAARRVFANLRTRHHKPGWLAGDILYTNQDATQFQIPAIEEGFDLVLGYGVNQLGAQGAHASGMIQVEGTWTAPCVPNDLIEASARLRTKEITLAEFHELIRRRREYAMRNKEKAKAGAKGSVTQRFGCPASGANPTAICDLKPKSKTPRPTRQSDGTVVDVRRKIKHLKVLTKGVAPKVCTQETVTATAQDGAKYAQKLQFGTPEHADIYKRLRQSQEGVHGTAKDEAGVALANPGRRRIRGWAAQQLFVAFLLAETATRRIITFVSNHRIDENGDMYVARRPGTSPTGAKFTPPGGPPIIEPEPSPA